MRCSLLADIGERLCLYCVNICAEIVAIDVKKYQYTLSKYGQYLYIFFGVVIL